MPESRQTGFTLVELMVALLIGSIVVLGAGYLFFTTFQTFQKVDELSRKQEAVIFAAHTLSDGIRKADRGDEPYKLTCEVKSDDQCRCALIDETNDSQPVVSFDHPPDECAVKDIDFSENVVPIRLPLEKNSDLLEFRVAKRQPILEAYLGGNNGNNGKSPDPSNNGYYKDGTKMYNDRCYNGNSNSNGNGKGNGKGNGNGKFNSNREGCNAP